MKALFIYHMDSPVDLALQKWLASFTELSGVLIIEETSKEKKKRAKRQLKRTGIFRFFDVALFRFYYRLFLAKKDSARLQSEVERILKKYSFVQDQNIPSLVVESPNKQEAHEFIKRISPDIVIARSKFLIKESVFSIPPLGTYVMHPGICPEYRNSHGCFWALANRDIQNAGLTLIKIDKGVDTGPVYGYYTYDFDEVSESHIEIQEKMILRNLESLKDKLLEIEKGCAEIISTKGRKSMSWGQPWLSKYLFWKFQARLKRKNSCK